MVDEQRSQVDIEIEFPLVNFGGGKNGDEKTKTAMFDLTHETYSPFNGCQNWQVFIFCCTYGFAHKKVKKTPPGAPAMPPSAFKSETRDVMRTIAIADTKDLRIIKKASGKNGYVRICEEYAYSALILGTYAHLLSLYFGLYGFYVSWSIGKLPHTLKLDEN